MPQDVPGEMSRRELADTSSQLSFLSLHKEQPTDFAIAFSASAFTSGVVADVLTRNTLLTPISERQGLARWWETNSSDATKEIFATQRNGVEAARAVIANAEAEGVKAADAFLRSVDSLDNIGRHIARHDLHLTSPLRHRAEVLAKEVDSLTRILDAKPDRVGAEVERAIRTGSTELTPATRAILREYQDLVMREYKMVPEAAALRPEIHDAVSALRGESVRVSDEAVRMQQIPRRIEFLTNIMSHKPSDITAVLGNAAEVEAGTKLFETHSGIGQRLTRHIEIMAAGDAASAEVRLARTGLVKELAYGAKPLMPSAEYLQTGAGRVVKAFGLATISMGVGYGADSAIGKLFNLNNGDSQTAQPGARLAIDGCLVPALIMSELPTKFKLPAAAAAFAAGRASNLVSSNDFLSPGMATLLKPNQADTFLLGTAVMTPLGGRYKAAAIAGAIGVGRLVNYFAPEEKREEKSLLSL